MKTKIFILIIVLVILFVTVVLSCFNPRIQIYLSLMEYSQITKTDIPKDLHLTIYYIDPTILTRYPLSVNDLVSWDGVRIIDVSYDQLANHSDSLKKLDASILRPSKVEDYLNARLYYVFETDHGQLLDVAISHIGGHVYVNGIEVENNPVFYDIIVPFMSEDDLQILGI